MDVVDLCETSEEEAEVAIVPSSHQHNKSNNNDNNHINNNSNRGVAPVICLDLSMDEESTNDTVVAPPPTPKQEPVAEKQEAESVPKEQEVIELGDSSDDEVEVVDYSVAIARAKAAEAAAAKDSDSSSDSDSDEGDSSDDELALLWHKPRQNNEKPKATTALKPASRQAETHEAKPAAAVKPAPQQTEAHQEKPATALKPAPQQVEVSGKKPAASNVQLPGTAPRKLPPKERSTGESISRGKSTNVSSGGQARGGEYRGTRTQHVNASMQSARSPSRKQAFIGKPRTPSPGRKPSQDLSGKQSSSIMPSAREQVQKKSSDRVAITRPNIPAKKPANNHTVGKPESGTNSKSSSLGASPRRTYESDSSSDASLLASRSVFAKRPVNDTDAARHKPKTSGPRKVPQSERKLPESHKQPAGRGFKNCDEKQSPRKRPAVKEAKPSILPAKSHGRKSLFQRPNPPPTKPRNKMVLERKASVSSSSSKNSIVAQSRKGKNAPNKQAKKTVFGAVSRASKKLKSPPPPSDGLVALGRKNKGNKTSLLNQRIRMSATARPSNSPPMPKRTPPLSSGKTKSILRDRKSGENSGPSKQRGAHGSETGSVHGTLSPTTLDKGAGGHLDPSTEESSQQPPMQTDLGNTVESPYLNKDESSRNSSSCGSVVSPTEDMCDPTLNVPVSSRSPTEASHFDATTDSRNAFASSTSPSTEKAPTHPSDTEDLQASPDSSEAAQSRSSSTENASMNSLASVDSPMVASQASSEFNAPSDSDSEMGDETEDNVVAENTKVLIDSLSSVSDEGLKPWTRKTRKRIDYSDTTKIETPDDQLYLDTASRKRQKAETSKSNVAETSDNRKRKRKAVSDASSESSRGRESVPDLEEEGEDPVKACLPPVDHLSKYTYDEDGHPTHQFSVLGSDDTIFDLKIQVKPSGIPNSGMGAFLTFEGARVLKEELREVAAKKREERVYYEADTMQPLGAVSPDGYGIAVKLTGKNVHGNRNLQYWPATAIPTLRAKLPEENALVKVKLTGDHLHYDDSEDEEEPLEFSMCPKRVGHLGIHTERDYVSEPTIELSSIDFSVELGRYGPVLKTDRKREPDYDVKNYCYGDYPAEYAFGVSEPMSGCRQVIDITDDATGTRHAAALALPMSYVNETGHDPNLKANVHLREKDDRSVYYYLTLVKALKKGETVELLANYDENTGSYEPVRERKGYGKENIENGVKSNDHEPSAIARNFDDRQQIRNLINGLGLVSLFHLTEFVAEDMLLPLNDVIDSFLDHDKAVMNPVKPTRLQWLARHRLSWLGELILQRTSCLLQDIPGEPLPGSCPHKSLLLQTRKWAEEMHWPRLCQSVRYLAKHDLDACETLKVASREDILYRLSEKIAMPLDEAMWCPAASKLIKSLCDDTALFLSVKNGDTERTLLHLYLSRAKEAELTIRAACRGYKEDGNALALLKFVSRVAKDEIVDVSTLDSFEGFKDNNFFRKHTTVRKGILASLLQVQSHRDLKLVPKGTLHEVLMVEGGASEGDVSGETGVVGYPGHADSAVKSGRVYEDWYLLWQVVYVVHCFAEEFIGKSTSEEAHYSLERLCGHVRVDPVKAKAVVDQGIDTTEYFVAFVGKSRPRKKRAPRGSAPQKRAPSKAAAKRTGPTINRKIFDDVVWKALVGIGWSLNVGTRPTDHYFLPPGVERRRGWTNRKDYFDSTKLVMQFIRTDSRWKDRSEVVEAVALFDKVTALKDKVQLPKNWTVDWLISQLS